MSKYVIIWLYTIYLRCKNNEVNVLKRQIMAIFGVFVLFLMSSGCSHNVPNSEELLKDNEDYQKFISLTANHAFDENYYYDYNNNTESSIEIPEGKIHISFADNSFLNVNYYFDNQCTQQVNTKACFLAPGDKIYASQPLIKSSGTNKYDFDGFQVCCIDNDGSRIRQPELEGEKNEQGYYTVLTIPAKYEYNDTCWQI